MERRKFMCTLLATMMSANALWADTEQTVYINNTAIDDAKFVINLAFNGDKLTMTYDDGYMQTEDMASVSILLHYDNEDTGIKQIDANGKQNGGKGVYTIDGQYLGSSTTGLPNGTYIVNGKQTIIK